MSNNFKITKQHFIDLFESYDIELESINSGNEDDEEFNDCYFIDNELLELYGSEDARILIQLENSHLICSYHLCEINNDYDLAKTYQMINRCNSQFDIPYQIFMPDTNFSRFSRSKNPEEYLYVVKTRGVLPLSSGVSEITVMQFIFDFASFNLGLRESIHKFLNACKK